MLSDCRIAPRPSSPSGVANQKTDIRATRNVQLGYNKVNAREVLGFPGTITVFYFERGKTYV